MSRLVTPLIHLNILISASNFFACAVSIVHVSASYIIAGLTTVLYTFPLTLTTKAFITYPQRLLQVYFSSKTIKYWNSLTYKRATTKEPQKCKLALITHFNWITPCAPALTVWECWPVTFTTIGAIIVKWLRRMFYEVLWPDNRSTLLVNWPNM